MTVDQIAEQLKIAKSTAYEWVKHIPIPRTNGQTEAQRRATEAMQAKFKKIRDNAYEQGLAEAPELLNNPMFRDFVTLYIAEGYKRSKNEVAVSNSDASVIGLCYYWIKKYTKNKIGFFVQTHVDLDDDEVKAYWANLIGIDPDEIAIYRKSNSGELEGRNWRSEHGVFTMRSGDTVFRLRLQGWIDYIKDQWMGFSTSNIHDVND